MGKVPLQGSGLKACGLGVGIPVCGVGVRVQDVRCRVRGVGLAYP